MTEVQQRPPTLSLPTSPTVVKGSALTSTDYSSKSWLNSRLEASYSTRVEAHSPLRPHCKVRKAMAVRIEK